MPDDTGCHPASVKRYAWERLLKASTAPQTTRLVGLILATYTNRDGTNAHPGIERLRQDCDINSEKTVRTHLAKLVELGLIHRTFEASRAGRRDLADVYILTDPAVTSGTTGKSITGPPVNHPRSSYQAPMHDTNDVPHHSASLPLAHDKSRADDEDDYDDLIEDVRDRVEAWSEATYGCGLDSADHQLIDGMGSSGAHPKLIENTAKAKIRGFEQTYPRPSDPWADASDVPF